MKYKMGATPSLPLSKDRILVVNNSIRTLFLRNRLHSLRMKYKMGATPNLPLSNDRILEVNNSIWYSVVAWLPPRAITRFLQNFLCRNLDLAPVLKKYTGYQIYQCKYNRRASTLVSIYVTQDKYNRRTSTLILCKQVIVRAQQENKGSAINNKQKQCDNDNNQTLYTT
jgi:hypothetical protein